MPDPSDPNDSMTTLLEIKELLQGQCNDLVAVQAALKVLADKLAVTQGELDRVKSVVKSVRSDVDRIGGAMMRTH